MKFAGALSDPARSNRIALSLALVASAALCLAPLAGHIDDVDAQTYLVVARNIARTGHWFSLTFLPDVWPVFREHLPFGFWPGAAAIRLFGEPAVPFVYAAFAVGAIWATAELAGVYGGPECAVVAALMLGTCESIWHYAARLLLEPPLFFFAMASCLAWAKGRWKLAGCLAGLAVLVKGPFGLLPLAAIGLASLLRDRTLLARFVAAVSISLVPVALFVSLDALLAGGSWWTGYVQRQILASAAGARRDGVMEPWYPLVIIWHRFWPGLPLVAYGLLQWRKRHVRELGVAALVLVAILCIPTRKWGNHMYIAFPLLAAFGGVAARDVVARADRVLLPICAVAAAAAVVFAAAGGGRLVLPPPCDLSGALGDALRQGPPAIAVVGGDGRIIPELAAELDLRPRPAREAADTGVTLLPRAAATPERFQELARGASWKLVACRP